MVDGVMTEHSSDKTGVTCTVCERTWKRPFCSKCLGALVYEYGRFWRKIEREQARDVAG